MRPRHDTPIDLASSHELTAGLIARLHCPADKSQAFLRDRKAPGLRVRVTGAGAKSFVFEAKLGRDTIRRTIGDVRSWSIEDARTEANRLRVLVDTGKDPRELERQEAERRAAEAKRMEVAEGMREQTLRKLCSTYCSYLKSEGKSSWRDAEGIFDNHLLDPFPDLAETVASEVSKASIVAVQRRLVEAGKKTTARKFRAYLRAAYTRASRADSDSTLPASFVAFGITDNPVASTAPIKTRPDKRPLSETEILRYWAALKTDPSTAGAALRVHLLTGAQRAAQLMRATAERDLSDDRLRLWDGKGNRDEAREHLIPLTGAIRKELKMLSTEGFIFSTDGGITPMHPTSLSAWAGEIGKSAGIDGFQLKRVRSGVETLLAAAGIPLHIRGQLQSHGISGVQATHYDAHEYLAEKRHALTVLHRKLERPTARPVGS
ncbi:integrase family protein [Caenimonas sedimenti]|uniref:Integrase family protein n=1 Tax=Caenimonas sedimenti TaxID=2596921 RepID=A0A562ZNZ3_9BURK|nr:integrase family protein [Caenimonas sedimenti]TWO70091.1 integrase family protein [Caenimonas sedimenti]